MDPKTALYTLGDLISQGSTQEAWDLALGLESWFSLGGYCPALSDADTRVLINALIGATINWGNGRK